MTSDEWLRRFRDRLIANGLDDDMVRASVDATAGAISDEPAVMAESPEDAADEEFRLMGDDS